MGEGWNLEEQSRKLNELMGFLLTKITLLFTILPLPPFSLKVKHIVIFH